MARAVLKAVIAVCAAGCSPDPNLEGELPYYDTPCAEGDSLRPPLGEERVFVKLSNSLEPALRITEGSEEKTWIVGGNIVVTKPTLRGGKWTATIYQLGFCGAPVSCAGKERGVAVSNCFPILLRGLDGNVLVTEQDSMRMAYRFRRNSDEKLPTQGVIEAPVAMVVKFSSVVEVEVTAELASLDTSLSGRVAWEVIP